MNTRLVSLAAAIVAVSVLGLCLAGCGKKQAGAPETSRPRITVNGAGATFPYPIYAKWAHKYQEITGVRINYQSIGSGGGIQQIKAGTVHFGASDAPLTPEELDEAGLMQFPLVMGGVTPVVNIKGVEAGELKLSPSLLADILLGKVKNWKDPAIEAENPELELPDRAITVVHRADGSGTTWIFTTYLDEVSPAWHSSVGAGKSVSWPVGSGGKGNEGVAAYVQRIEGSIGYVEYAYALQNKMAHVKLKNRAGSFVEPSISTFQSAAANADWEKSPGFYVVLTNQSGEDSWPITGASYILIHKEQKDAAVAKAMLGFFEWAYHHGAEMAEELDYVPMPKSVIDLVTGKWNDQVRANGKPVLD